MQINMRKILAVLSCIAMLCTVLPLSAMVSAADGFIPNGDFESSDLSAWKIGSGKLSNVLTHGGTQSLYSDNNTTSYGYSAYIDNVAVKPNSDYTVTFWYTYASDASKTMRLYVHDAGGAKTNINAANGGSQPVIYCKDTSAVSGTWKQASVTFNSGANTAVMLKFGGGSSGYNAVYLDDIVMTGPAPSEGGDEPSTPETPVEPELPPVATQPSNDGYIINGDFATGALDPWTVSKGGKVAVVDGSYVLQGTATAKYEAFVKQSVTVEANTDYLITFKAKLAKSGGQIRFVVNGNGTRLNNDAYYFTSTTNWQTFQIQVNSGDNTTLDLVPTQGVTNGGDIYYDDITMKKITGGYQGSYPEQMTSGADIRFMTYNVLVGQDTSKGGYSWGSAITGRPEKACAMINYYKPDVIALEEFSGEWYEYFQANMPDYAFGIMESKDSQNNGILYTCLAYNVNTIRLLDTDLFRNTVSRWGTQGMRYVNVGFFEVIATGEKFIGAATHPDAGKLVGDQDLNGDGKAEEGDGYWRPQMLEEAAKYVAGLSEQYQMPVIWGGDFNSGLDGTYDDNVSWYKVADAGFTDATAGRYIDHIFYNGMATHLYETTVSDAAVNGASDHKAVFADIQFLDEFATPIKNAKDYIKTQGRTTLKDGAMWLDYSASGIEFSANCEGKVALNLSVKSIKNTDATYGGIYFTVIVDGVKVDRAQCRITSTGSVELVLAENLPAGNHTFEVYRQTEHRGAEVGITSIVMNGSFNAKPEDNRLYIEFIGDSISTGYGALGVAGADQADSPLWQDATVAYPYLTAKALNADFSDVCYSGLGCKYGYSGSLSMQTVYTAQRYQYDKTTQYNFNARQPDVVVLALGTNDIANQTDAALRKAGYQEMLDLVRAKNPDAKIVWIYGMMKDDDNEMIAALIEENGGAAEGLFSLELVTNTSGAGWHPSAAGQAKFAEDLVAFLNSDVLVKYVGDEMVDNDEGRKVSYEGSSRTEETETGLGLAFRFQVKADGIAVVSENSNVVDLSNATIDAFGDGSAFKLVRMGAIVSNDALVGLADMKLADVDGKRTINIDAKYLQDWDEASASFAVRITNIPAENEATMVYARAYYVFEYEGREVVMYDDIQAANYINKYESNDGVLEW